LLWCLAWLALVRGTPAEDPLISSEELAYITQHVKRDAEQIGTAVEVTRSASPPWLAFVTTREAVALYVAVFVNNFVQVSTTMYLAKYYVEVWHDGMETAGQLAAFPNLIIFGTSLAAGQLGDWLIANCLSVTHTRVLLHFFFCAGSGGLMVLTGSVSTEIEAAVTLALAVSLFSMATSSVCINYVDISPHHATALFSVGNTVANAGAVVGPLVVGDYLGNPEQSATENWRDVFHTMLFLLAGSWVVFAAFGSGKPVQALN